MTSQYAWKILDGAYNKQLESVLSSLSTEMENMGQLDKYRKPFRG